MALGDWFIFLCSKEKMENNPEGGGVEALNGNNLSLTHF